MKRINAAEEEMVLVGTKELEFAGLDPNVVQLLLMPNSKNVTAAWEELFGRLILGQNNRERQGRILERYRHKQEAGQNDSEVYYTVDVAENTARLNFYI